jgi:hypothetical protein
MFSVSFSSKCSLIHNSNLFSSPVIHILYTVCAKIKKNNSGAKRLTSLFNRTIRSSDKHRCIHMMKHTSIEMLATFTNPTIYDVRRNLVPLTKLPHMLYSHLISPLDNLMKAYIQSRNM